ncbi:hypothetical protein LOTGIDRAFT_236717 [Lottia gigantea]|uniref:VWFA domain-containing protein n=1 Tax=Lottia gigantea TaxID=225164 RepID=V3ZLI2_LOTGI|nr:hypothetical protein LOTGIDRAFT_236717 [Lottia gigantea]ESO83270.1 hypothetical protein LOTGIDRAFT_236717 [Lottia gigantea]
MNLVAISIMVICGVMHQSLTSPLQNGCKETPLDVIAVLDGSESITDEKFTQVKIALEQLIRSLRLQYHDSRFGVVLYSSSVSAVLPFSNNEMDLINRIRALEQPMEGTQTHLGLEEMNKMFRMEGRPHAAKVGIVFTDGISKNKVATSTAARESIRTEINMFSIGTSMDINMEELQIIASSNDRVLSLETISEIYNHLKGFIQSCGDIGCKDYMDVVTVVDGSDSISHTEFESVKNAVKEFVQELSLESPLSRFSLVLFSSNVSNVIDFTHNKADLLSQIDSLEQPRDGTDTAAALEKTNALMNISGRQGVPKIIVVITDGYSKNSTQTIIHADEAKNMGINVFSIGITDKKQDTELVSIASDIDKSLVLEDFKELSKLVMEDVRKACGG